MNWDLSIVYPWWFILLCVAIGVVYAYVLYGLNRPDDSDIPRFVKWLLPVLRFSLASFLSFLLLSPILNFKDFETEKPILLVLVDQSTSLKNSKSPVSEQSLSEAVAKLKNELADKLDVDVAGISNNTEFVTSDSITLDGSETNISSGLRFLKEQYVNSNIQGAVLISDGIYNAGTNPEFATEIINIPIYTVGVGDSQEYADFKVQEVSVNSIAYLGNEFPVKVAIKATKLKGKSGQVQVIYNGTTVSKKAVFIDSDSYFVEEDFKLKANSVGQGKLTVTLTTFENEENTSNNTFSSYIEVIDGKKKVEIWTETWHPDLGMLKSAINTNDNYECGIVNSGFVADGSKDLVVLHNWFVTDPQLKLFEKLKALGTPCFIVFGKDFNYRMFNLSTLNVKFNRVGSGKNAALPLVNGGFEYFELDDNQKSIVNKWPPLSSPFGKIKGFKNSDMVMHQKIGAVATEEPLIAITSDNNYRFGIASGTGLWQWRLADFEKNNNHETSNLLVNKLVQYLSVKQEKKLLKVYPTAVTYNLGDEVKLIGELYNQSLEPITNQEINVELVHPDNSKTKHSMTADGLGYQLSLKNYAEGSYTFRAVATVGGKTLVDKGYFSISGTEKEMNNLTADFKLLQNMSSESGGEFYSLSALNDLIAELKSKDAQSVIVEREVSRNLVDFKWIFWLLFGMLGLEWFVRKWVGIY